MTSESTAKIIENKDEISAKELLYKISEWWRYLVSKWLVILLFSLLGAALGFLYAFIKKPLYTATTTFVLEEGDKSSSLGSLGGLASMAGIDLGGGGGGLFQGDNILQLYTSRTMLEQTLLTPIRVEESNQLLVERYIEFNKLREKWADNPALVKLKFTVDSLHDKQFLTPNRLRDSILGVIVVDLNKNYLTASKPDKKLSTLQVDVRSKDEFFAKVFNDELVKNVNEFYIKTKTKKTLQNVQILQHKTDSVRAVMNGAIYSAVAVADATPNINPTRQIQRVAPAQKAQFSAETNKAVLGEMMKNLEISKMSLLKETPLIQVLDKPIYPLYRKKLGYVQGTIVGLILAGFLAVIFFSIRIFLKISVGTIH